MDNTKYPIQIFTLYFLLGYAKGWDELAQIYSYLIELAWPYTKFDRIRPNSVKSVPIEIWPSWS